MRSFWPGRHALPVALHLLHVAHPSRPANLSVSRYAQAILTNHASCISLTTRNQMSKRENNTIIGLDHARCTILLSTRPPAAPPPGLPLSLIHYRRTILNKCHSWPADSLPSPTLFESYSSILNKCHHRLLHLSLRSESYSSRVASIISTQAREVLVTKKVPIIICCGRHESSFIRCDHPPHLAINEGRG